MGVSFKKSFKIGKNTRINISKNGGIGISTGIRGFRISKNSKGLRFSLGGDGVYYTKWFTKKKRKKKNRKENKDEKLKKIKNLEKEEIIEEVIDPETDFERIPTEDEKALMLYIGSKERNYILYLLLITIIGLSVYILIKKDILAYSLGALSFLLLIMYLFGSKINKYIYGLNRSIKLFNKNRFDKSYKLLEKCVSYKPKSEKALILMMFTSFKLEKYEQALLYVEKFKERYEPLEVMHFIEGYCCSVLKKFDEGINAISKVYSEDDDIKYAKYKILGDCYLGLENYDKAISWYEELPVKEKKINDDIIEYKYAIGRALLLSGNKKRAFTYLSKVYDYKADYKDVKTLIDMI